MAYCKWAISLGKLHALEAKKKSTTINFFQIIFLIMISIARNSLGLNSSRIHLSFHQAEIRCIYKKKTVNIVY